MYANEMLHSRCAFCNHENPAGSKFCNECGSPLHLKPCAQCDAVNDYEAAACYRCNVPFPAVMSAEPRTDPRPEREPRTSVPEAFAESLSSAMARAGAPTIDAPFTARDAPPPRSPAVGAAAPADAGSAEVAATPSIVASTRFDADSTQTATRGTPRDGVEMPANVAAEPSSARSNDEDAAIATPQALRTASDVEPAPSPDVAAGGSLVVPADEARLAAARDGVASRRRRRMRTAIAAMLVVAAAGAVYYEYRAPNPVGAWLRAVETSVVNAITGRAEPASKAIDETTRTREPAAAASETPPAAATAVTPPAAPTAAPAETAPAETAPADNAASTAAPTPPPAPPEETKEATPPAPSATKPAATDRPTPKKSAPDRKRRSTRGSPAASASPTR
jgi:hypothetical protein